MSPTTTDTENFLLEVGVEELPASYIAPALEHIETTLREGLADSRLGTGKINTYSTPRRLAVYVHDLQLRQEDSEEEATGPAVKAAYDADGNPTMALQGFARGKGVELSEIRRVQTDKGEYVAATVKHVGKPAAEVLHTLIERALETTLFPKTMRWSQTAPAFRFARPIRWLVCLLGGEVVPVEVAGVTSGSQTRGHRFLSPDASPIGLAQSYLATLKQAHVIVDSAARRSMLVEGIEKLASEAGGTLVEDEELIDINNNLVELPQAFMGRFDPSYLELPREVVVTAMLVGGPDP